MTVAGQRSQHLDRPSSSGLADVVDLILDKGLVIDVYVRVSLVGIELLTIDARIVVASVDTYLRFAEAVNRLDLTGTQTHGLPELMQDMRQGGAQQKTKGALEGVKEQVGELLHGGEDDEEPEEEPEREEPEFEERPRRRTRPAQRREREP
ncbi:gas vesicle protein GvpJ [Peterkaempfera bronchialis]|uniref:Gas vesicle protein A n=1 Tax=Peterkaempfera bronchialis TaxID=2126346 RepID=A0A345SVY7_9ACTN|nr:gas vesicle protein GvpJ [Peterkaempfera bronchialis]AXI77892.1 gas vesicle protein [Peterkaempfera bronchialis]